MDILGKFTRRSERSAKTWKDTKTYFSQRYDLLKLEFLEKSTQLLSVIFSMLIVIVCALVVLIYLSSAVIHWLTMALGAAWAYTILCVLFVGIIVFVLAKKSESAKIFQLIDEIDPNAFVSQSAVIGVYGEGFDRFKVSHKHSKPAAT